MHTRKFGPDEPPGTRADVALGAADTRVRGIQEGAVLRRHGRVAGESAELGGVHVLHTFVSGRADDSDVQRRRSGQHEHQATRHGRTEIHLRVFGGQVASPLLLSPFPEQADGHEDKASHKQAREDHEKEDAQVGIGRARVGQFQEPVPDQADAGGRGERRPQERDPVVGRVRDDPRKLPGPFAETHDRPPWILFVPVSSRDDYPREKDLRVLNFALKAFGI